MTDAPCRPETGWLSGETYCAVHGRAAGWPRKVTRQPDDLDLFIILALIRGDIPMSVAVDLSPHLAKLVAPTEEPS
jgi:hypothetical protein